MLTELLAELSAAPTAELLVSLLVLLGGAFALIGSIGLASLPDFFTRLHGPTKSTTLGLGAMLAASTLYFSTKGDGLAVHELLVAVFLFMSAPVSANLLAKTALHLKVRSLAAIPKAYGGDSYGGRDRQEADADERVQEGDGGSQ
jgi:multicomponent K+:H+ antiporter subunit G